MTEGLASSVGAGMDVKELNRSLSRLAPRWLVVRNAHEPEAGSILLNPRHTMSLMRGPLTRAELRMARRGWGARVTPLRAEPAAE